MNKWTREGIIRDILRRDAAGLPLNSSVGEQGIEFLLYRAAARIFGSWKNAVVAAGLPASKARSSGVWTPSRIRALIRSLSRRKQPLSTRELEERYGQFIHAARRHFGSWAKAVMAAGIDPQRMRRSPAWSKERIIEGILTLELRNEPLERRLVQPRALVDAGTRRFGSWKAALAAAGVKPAASLSHVQHGDDSATNTSQPRASSYDPTEVMPSLHRPHTHWATNEILEAIRHRVRNSQPVFATVMFDENPPLYCAAIRRFGNWGNALLAAGLEPSQHRKAAKTIIRDLETKNVNIPSDQFNPPN